MVESLTIGNLAVLGRAAAEAALLSLAVAALAAVAWRAARSLGLRRERAIVVGTHEEALRIVQLVRAYPRAGIEIAGVVVRDPPAASGADDRHGRETLAAIEEMVAAQRVRMVVVGDRLDRRPALLRDLRTLRYAGLVVHDFLSLCEALAREVPVQHVDDRWLFQASKVHTRFYARRMKRVLDVLAALLLVPPAAILVGLAAIAIRLDSPGPILFRQERLGRRGRPFQLLKLRSMRVDAEAGGPAWASDRDPRVTRVGAWLRKFRVDELPQLANVLRGEMSLIGPRPERAVFFEKLAPSVPHFAERLLVLPGVTGWAQVMAPYAASVEDSRRKLQFDLYYAKHMSFGLDALILAKTALTMVFGRERDQGGVVTGAESAAVACVADRAADVGAGIARRAS